MRMSIVCFCVFLFLQGHLIGRSDADNKPPVISYKFTDNKDNVTCMMADFSAQLMFPIPAGETVVVTDGKVNEKESKCDDGNNEQKLVINFTFKNLTEKLTFTFLNTSDQARLIKIHLDYNGGEFDEMKNETIFQVPLTSSYRCESGLDVFMEKKGSIEILQNVTLSLRDVRFDVFRTSKTQDYDSDYVCAADIKGNKTVPMIVAFVLAGMVVIILVGYLILRRREDRSAYQSV